MYLDIHEHHLMGACYSTPEGNFTAASLTRTIEQGHKTRVHNELKYTIRQIKCYARRGHDDYVIDVAACCVEEVVDYLKGAGFYTEVEDVEDEFASYRDVRVSTRPIVQPPSVAKSCANEVTPGEPYTHTTSKPTTE